MKYTYLLIDFFTVFLPLCFSFNPKIAFTKIWPVFFPAVFITAIFFVFGDIFFTGFKIWGFNYKYVTGYVFVNLPIEEVLFFFCIPYACVFTYHSLNILYFKNKTLIDDKLFTLIFIVSLIIVAIIFHSKIYTVFAFTLLAVLLLVSKYLLKVKWLTRFYMTYVVLLLPFFVVNGLLTGTGINEPIVWYNKSTYIGLRLLTIPVEDIFYGIDLILLNVIILTMIQSRVKKNELVNITRAN